MIKHYFSKFVCIAPTPSMLAFAPWSVILLPWQGLYFLISMTSNSATQFAVFSKICTEMMGHCGVEVLTSHHVVLSSPFPLYQDNRDVSNEGYLFSLAPRWGGHERKLLLVCKAVLCCWKSLRFYGSLWSHWSHHPRQINTVMLITYLKDTIDHEDSHNCFPS